jgi:hypothetical protein
MTPVKRLDPSPDTSAADWVVAGLRGFAESVLSIVPAGFPAYVRIFHPAKRRYGDQLANVRWSEIAAANSRQYHAAMQLTSLAGSFESYTDGQLGVFEAAPEIGSLPIELTEPLSMLLAEHTRTPDKAWFAFWEGFGGIPGEIAAAPRFETAGRKYHLLTGSVAAARDGATEPWQQSANLWWAGDRAWCVATEIDLDTTYVGCNERTAAAIVGHAGLEALKVDPTSGVAFDSDERNPKPPH